jgi:hypothetical protein
MLVGLLLCCLTVPLFWGPETSIQHPIAEIAATAERAAAPLATNMHRDVTSRLTRAKRPLDAFDLDLLVQPSVRPLANEGWVMLCPSPTMEELAGNSRLGIKPLESGAGWRHSEWSRWPSIPVPATAPDEEWQATDSEVALASLEANPLIASALQRVGNALATYSVADAVIQWAVRADALRRLWPSDAAGLEHFQVPISPTASTFRLIDANDRAAMLPETAPAQVPEPEPAPPVSPPQQTSPPAPTDADIAGSSDPWCVPQALFEQLERLAHHPISARWAQETIDQLHIVTERANWESGRVAVSLDALSGLAAEATRLAETTGDDRLRVELLRAHWALSRRLDCWRAIGDIRVAAVSSERIASRGSLESLFSGIPQPAQDRSDLPTLTDNLEAYEASRDPRLARQVVEEQQALRASGDALDQSLADVVEQHYRNANVRIAITAKMLNRLIAQQRSEMRAVRDWIAGTPVRGQSLTHSESFVRLQPAHGRWQLDLQTQGTVESDTLANGGKARLRSFGATDFTAQKSIVVDTNGVHLQSAYVGATNYNRLVGVRTQYDWVPLFGAYARSKAVDQYRAKRPRAKAEVEAKVAAQAQDDVDRETSEAVQRIEQDVRNRFTDPIAQAGIEVTPIELSTTAERIVARLRVAGNHQLGSHTPRPRALGDSLASFQLHESALTNAAVSLQLDGAQYTAPQLQEYLRETFPGMALAMPAETRSDTIFEFHYRDAVQFRILGGRVELLLSLIGFQHEGRRTRDFIVHAFYAPVVDGLEVELVRDGPLGIEGRLSATERARLHNVFNTVLAEDRRLKVVALKNPTDPRLSGLMITQLVLEDGWIGAAIGPERENRVAERSRSLR